MEKQYSFPLGSPNYAPPHDDEYEKESLFQQDLTHSLKHVAQYLPSTTTSTNPSEGYNNFENMISKPNYNPYGVSSQPQQYHSSFAQEIMNPSSQPNSQSQQNHQSTLRLEPQMEYINPQRIAQIKDSRSARFPLEDPRSARLPSEDRLRLEDQKQDYKYRGNDRNEYRGNYNDHHQNHRRNEKYNDYHSEKRREDRYERYDERKPPAPKSSRGDFDVDSKMVMRKLIDLENAMQILQDALNQSNAKIKILEKTIAEKTSSENSEKTKDEKEQQKESKESKIRKRERKE